MIDRVLLPVLAFSLLVGGSLAMLCDLIGRV
jgi:hypothetical protein